MGAGPDRRGSRCSTRRASGSARDGFAARVERVWPGARRQLRAARRRDDEPQLKVEVDGEAFVLRIGGKDTELLGIDRSVELAATAAAAALGFGPEVVDFVEPEGYLVTRFIEGDRSRPEEMRGPATIAGSLAPLRRFHEGPAIPGRFDSFRVVEVYRQTAARSRRQCPGGVRLGTRGRAADRGARPRPRRSVPHDP